MKYVRIDKTMSIKPIGGGFLMPILDTGTLLLVESEETDGSVIASFGKDRFKFRKDFDNISIIVYEVPTIVYDLWYKGTKTEHTFDPREVPDIRKLGFDVNEEHEFKMRMIIK